jgi:uncharacterized membrane protein
MQQPEISIHPLIGRLLTIDNLSKSVSFYLHARLSAGYFRSRDRQKSNFPIK